VAGFYTKGFRLKFLGLDDDDDVERVSLTLLYFSTADAIPCAMSQELFAAMCARLGGHDYTLSADGVVLFSVQHCLEVFPDLLPFFSRAPLCPGAVSCHSGPDTALWAGMVGQQWYGKDKVTLRATTLPALASVDQSALPHDICVRTAECAVWLPPLSGDVFHRRCVCCSNYNSATIPNRKAAAVNAKLTSTFTILHTEVTLLLAATKAKSNTGSDSPVCERLILASLMCCRWRVRSCF
jgi:hypothetical protein